jgi:hypothetical protein
MSVKDQYHRILQSAFQKAGLDEVTEDQLSEGTYTNAQIVEKMHTDFMNLITMLMEVSHVHDLTGRRTFLCYAVDQAIMNAHDGWTSKTKQFGEEELRMLEKEPATEIIGSLLMSYPVVGLRALAEVLLNGDIYKLSELLASQELNEHWHNFTNDFLVDDRDHFYASLLDILANEA